MAKELFKEKGLSYRILTSEFRDETLMVLSRAFCTEPVVNALVQIKPEMETHLHDWVEFVEYWMPYCSTNGLSVIAVDEENHRVAGAFIVRDLFFMPPGFEEKYGKNHQVTGKTLAPWMNFLWDLDEAASKQFELLQAAKLGEFVDLWFLGVHPDYRGRKIANSLIKGIIPLITKAGYKYGTIEATSYFTSQAAKFNGFEPVVNIEASSWVWDGSPLYINAPQPHGVWTFWIKSLQNNDQQ